MAEGKNWVFTDFNLHTDYSSLDGSYVIYGIEKCEEGRVHHQGYIEFQTNRKLNRLKKFDREIHWELRQGNQAQAIDYCKKDGEYTESGEAKAARPGTRNDLVAVRTAINNGAGMREICDIATSYQSIKMAEVYLKHIERQRDWMPEVTWFYGKTGSGKTRKAVEEAGNIYYMSSRNLKWWEGYDAHENVIIDDFRKDFCTFHELLRILDRYPYRVEVKGGSRQLLAKKIWITSCYHPRDVYDTREDIEQLIRRINLISNLRFENEIEVQGNTNPEPDM